MNQTLYILVDDFSSDKKEAFFERELPYLCEQFKRVKVISLYPEKNKALHYDHPNLEVLQFNYFAACNRLKVLAGNFFSITRIFFYELSKTHNKGFYFKNFRSVLNQLVLTFSAAKNFEKFISRDINEQTVFYCFWFKQWVAALSVIRLRQPHLKFVSRIHGGDYDEDQIKTTLPFRYFQLKMINKIFAISDFGRNYLIKTFHVHPDKIVTSRLGLEIEPQAPPIDPGKLVMVSCSSVIPLKRVHLIAEILRSFKTPAKWVHFGDGELFDRLKKTDLRGHEVELLGYQPNRAFMNYLANNPVSIFINVSESEGIPVSMMEAISNGIPLAGPAICGVPEIVNEETGILFPVNFKPAEVSEKIEKLHKEGKLYDTSFRNGIRNFYKDRFFVPKNHKRLAELLVNV